MLLELEVLSQVGVVSGGEVAVEVDGPSVGGVARAGATVSGLAVEEPPHGSGGQAVVSVAVDVVDVDDVVELEDDVDEVLVSDDVLVCDELLLCDELVLTQLVVDGEDVEVLVPGCDGEVVRVGVVGSPEVPACVWVSGDDGADGSVTGAVVVTVVPGSNDGSGQGLSNPEEPVGSNGLPA